MFVMLTCIILVFTHRFSICEDKIIYLIEQGQENPQRACEEELQGSRLYSLEQLFPFDLRLLWCLGAFISAWRI